MSLSPALGRMARSFLAQWDCCDWSRHASAPARNAFSEPAGDQWVRSGLCAWWRPEVL